MLLEQNPKIIIIEDDPAHLKQISEIVRSAELEPIAGLDESENYTITRNEISNRARLLLCDDLLYSFKQWRNGTKNKCTAHYQGSDFAEQVKKDFPDFPIWSISSSPSESLLQYCDKSIIKTDSDFETKLFSRLANFRRKILAEILNQNRLPTCPTFEDRHVLKKQFELDKNLAYLLEPWELPDSKIPIPNEVSNKIRNLSLEESFKLQCLMDHFGYLGYIAGHFWWDMAYCAYFGAVYTGDEIGRVDRNLRGFFKHHVYAVNATLQARKFIKEGNEFWLK